MKKKLVMQLFGQMDIHICHVSTAGTLDQTWLDCCVGVFVLL